MTLEASMKILVVGSGGREHALCWKLAQSPLTDAIYCAPGNGGTATTEKTTNVNIDASDFHALTSFAERNGIELAVIGPDNPLADGIVDTFEAAGLRTFGPRKFAAKLEWSKAHAKEFMSACGVPTARFQICTHITDARDAILNNKWARVIKADGLALGKGVYVCDTTDDAIKAVEQLFNEDAGAAIARKVIVEERLYGEEISLMCLCDGKTIVPLLPSQDHKRRFDNDKGPNTGGMGAYAPVALYDKCREIIETMVIRPLQNALNDPQLQSRYLGGEYKGVLYIGLLLVEDVAHPKERYKPYVLEFNARFGDPETQAVLPLLKSDLLEHLIACTSGGLHTQKIQWSNDASCCVVAVAADYPKSSSRGELINLPGEHDPVITFHSGTKLTERGLESNGGRIFSVTATAPDMESARRTAYAALQTASFKGMDFRRDIAGRVAATCHST
jgi:phosphoribosylamine---glycine ligase